MKVKCQLVIVTLIVTSLTLCHVSRGQVQDQFVSSTNEESKSKSDEGKSKSDEGESGERCPASWHQFGDKCFYVNMTSGPVHSKENDQMCDKLNATSVTIDNLEENEFLRRLIFIHYDSHVWIWLSRVKKVNYLSSFPVNLTQHVSSHPDMTTLFWSSSLSRVKYDNWATGQTDNCDMCCEVALMTSGHWFESNCNSWKFLPACQLVLTQGQSSPGQLDPETQDALASNFYLAHHYLPPPSDIMPHDKNTNDTKVDEMTHEMTDVVSSSCFFWTCAIFSLLVIICLLVITIQARAMSTYGLRFMDSVKVTILRPE